MKNSAYYIYINNSCFEVISDSEKNAISESNYIFELYKKKENDKWDKCLKALKEKNYIIVKVDRPLIREIIN